MDLQPPMAGFEKFVGIYLLCGEQKAIIDVGPKVAVPNLLAALAESEVSPEEIDYIILTHIHIDHAGGLGTVLKEMPRAKVLVHSYGRSHLIDPSRLWEASLKTLGDLPLQYGNIEPVPEEKIIVATDQMKLDLGQGLILEIFLTPGHAPHHLSLFDRADGIVFAGEAAGSCVNGTIRPATPPPFRLAETLASIDRLIALGAQRVCFCHFGCYDNATEKLNIGRSRIITWHKWSQTLASEGKNPEEILAFLKENVGNFEYLNTLSKDAYQRELRFLFNTIRGLGDPKAR